MLHHVANIFCEPAPRHGRRGGGGGGHEPGGGGGEGGTIGAGTAWESYAGNVLLDEDGNVIKVE